MASKVGSTFNYWFAVVVVLVAVIIVSRRRPERMTVCADDPPHPTPQQIFAAPAKPQMVTTYPVSQECAQYCTPSAEQCNINLSLCIDTLADEGIDPTSIYAPPLIERCKREAADCRYKFLNCVNACGQLSY